MTTRQQFLGTGALLATLGASIELADAAEPKATPKPKPTPSEPPFPKLAFDMAAFDAILNRDVAHKHLFASKLVDGDGVFGAMRSTLHAYRDLGTPYSQIAPVAVLYHFAAVLGLDDAMWARYILPMLPKNTKDAPEPIKDILTAAEQKHKGNPALAKEGGEWDSSIPSLVADADAHFFVCNNALRGMASEFAHQTKRDPLAVYDDLSKHLIPNAMIVPAGVWAVHAIQERRYTLLQTSL